MQQDTHLNTSTAPCTAPELPIPDAEAWGQASDRDVSALLNPRPLALIGACGDEETCFATVAWITPASHTPPMLAFALRSRSRTMELLESAGIFSLCTLPANSAGVALAEVCGNRSGHTENKGAIVEHFHVQTPGERPVPIAHEALSWFVCSIDHIRETGDHLFVVGTVLQARTKCERDEKGRIACTESLLCVQHDTFARGNLL